MQVDYTGMIISVVTLITLDQWAVSSCPMSGTALKRLPARVNKIGKIESRGKVLKLSDKLNLTRPFTAREKNRPVI